MTETLKTNASPSTTWWYSKRPLTLPSSSVRALNESVRFSTSTPNAFGSGIVQWALPFADGSIDAIDVVDVVEHVRDDLSFYAELNRVLRIGGILRSTSTPPLVIVRPCVGARSGVAPISMPFPAKLIALIVRAVVISRIVVPALTLTVSVAPTALRRLSAQPPTRR